MKITGGKLKNKLITFDDHHLVRPTSSKVREAIFSMLGQDLSGLSFLDAFGGSGIMAMEAYSRGAFPVSVSEKNSAVSSQLRKMQQKHEVQISIHKKDAIAIIPSQEWDVIFLDPPYKIDVTKFLLKSFLHCTRYIIVETTKNAQLIDCPESWVRWKSKVYGNSKITIYRYEGG